MINLLQVALYLSGENVLCPCMMTWVRTPSVANLKMINLSSHPNSIKFSIQIIVFKVVLDVYLYTQMY